MVAALHVHRDFIISQGPQLFKSTLDYNDRLLWDTYDTAIWYSNAAEVRISQIHRKGAGALTGHCIF